VADKYMEILMETVNTTETRLETISRAGGFKKAALPDVHITPDERGIEINRVGVEGVAVPIVLNRKGGGEPVKTLAKVNMFGSLEKRLKGTNMSRFAQLFVTEDNHSALSGNAFPALLEKLATSLDTKDVYISASFDYWMNKTTPVSKISAPSGYSCRFIGQLVSGKLKFITEVTVPVASYCPCSKEMCLTDKKTGVGLGAHAQRGMVTLQVRTNPPTPGLWLEDMIRIAETSGSAELYPILKREDEKYVTIAGYDNPKFVEDISRDVGNKIQLLPEAVWYKVRTRNLESIHPYDVTSYVGQSKQGDEWVVDTRSFY